MITQKLANQIKPHQLKIEAVLILIFCAGLFLPKTQIGYYMTFIPISLFAMLYFVIAFGSDDPDDRIAAFLNKVLNLAFSVGFIGILYTIYQYPGAEMMLVIGLITMAIGLLGLFIFRIRNKRKLVDPLVFRVIIIAAILAVFMFYKF